MIFVIFDSFVIKYLVKYVKCFRDLIWKLLSTLSNKTVIVSSFFAIFMPKLTNSDATEHSMSIELKEELRHFQNGYNG